MGAGPGCAAGAGHAEAVSESVVELSEDVDVMDVSGLADALAALLCCACGRCGSAPVCGASAGWRQWLAREAALAASRSPRKVWRKFLEPLLGCILMVEDTSHMPMCNGSMLRRATRSLLFPGVWSTVPLLAGGVWRFELRCVAELPVCGGAAATGSGEPPAVVAQGVATLSRQKRVMPIGVPHPGGAARHPRGGGGQRTSCVLALVFVGPVARM